MFLIVTDIEHYLVNACASYVNCQTKWSVV